MAVAAPKPPAGELGVVVPGAVPSWRSFSSELFGGRPDDIEYVPELRWPLSVRTTYPRMRTDTQLEALRRGTFLPISRYAWGIDPNGADESIVSRICSSYNLPLIDDAIEEMKTGRSKPMPRQPLVDGKRNRFSFAAHRATAFKACEFGHYFFEQDGDVVDGVWQFRKLMPLPPRTISGIKVAQDGGLEYIRQSVGLESPRLEVGRLVAYVWDQDPGDWLGRSMYRSCYREWLLKDRLIRVDVINHERSGGAMIAEAAPNATQAEIAAMSQMMQEMRTGERAGGAVPNGTTVKAYGTAGSDRIASINRHDEAMARAWLLMVIQLGSTQTGARAVGDNFQELWGYAQEAIAIWFRDTFNEHVIEDDVDWNDGPNTAYVPRLVFVRPDVAQDPPTSDLAAGVDDGTVKLSRDIARQVTRGRKAERVASRKPVRAESDADSLPLPERQLRREPFDHEVRAQVNFADLDEAWQSQVGELVAHWQTIRSAQITELEQLVTGAGGDLEAIAALEATAAGGDAIVERLKAMATAGAAGAAGEATAQGVTAEVPDLAALEDELAARASALEQLLARSISEAAARKAVQLTGGAMTSTEVAAEVAAYLNGLSDVYLADQFGGALSAAQNAGRMAVMGANDASRLYASELLDVNTCDPCSERDGHQYDSLEQAAADYPAGGYHACLGGPRCRGTIVAVYDEAEATS